MFAASFLASSNLGERLCDSWVQTRGYEAKQNFEKNKIAVEINGEIIPKKDYETVQIKENDVIEVVSFVGGG